MAQEKEGYWLVGVESVARVEVVVVDVLQQTSIFYVPTWKYTWTA